MVFIWLNCQKCNKQYVAVPDPTWPERWLFFDPRSNDMEHPTHLCCGGLLCIHGHALDVVAPAAVMTSEGEWLLLKYADVSCGVMN